MSNLKLQWQVRGWCEIEISYHVMMMVPAWIKLKVFNTYDMRIGLLMWVCMEI